MEVLDKVLLQLDYKSFYSFFEHCKKKAKEKKEIQVASLTFEVPCLDPLFILQKFYELENKCFYFEHPDTDFAIAGISPILEEKFEGTERFKEVRDFSKSILKDTIIYPFDKEKIGTYFFTSFTFEDRGEGDSKRGSAYPAAHVFLAEWQVVRKNFRSFITINQVIDSQTDIELLSTKVWNQYLKVNSFNEATDLFRKESNGNEGQSQEVGGEDWYEKAVVKALDHIKAGDFEKVVIARAMEIEVEETFSPLLTLNHLRELYPSCRICLIGNVLKNFICASPEILVRVNNKKMYTEALAGTVSRGKTEIEDDFLGRTLLYSTKDIYEHQVVIEYITNCMDSIGLKATFKNKPFLKKLANVQHLCTSIEAQMDDGMHLLDLAAVLHPTAAVCGRPLMSSRKFIEEQEPFGRGLYAGVLGYFDYSGNGELVVGIRSASIEGKKAIVYAGSGIVGGSSFLSERDEIDLKFQVMLKNLLQ